MKKYIYIESKIYRNYDSLITYSSSKNLPPEDNRSLQRHYIQQKEKIHQIDKNLLDAEHEVNFSIFVYKGLNFSPIIEASEKSPTKIPAEILLAEGDFVIKNSDMPLYKEYLDSLFNKMLLDNDKEKIKSLLTKEKTKIIVRDILQNPRSGENIKMAETAVQDMASTILNNKDIMYDLISMKTYDYYTYTHSVNVEVLSIGFAIALGLSNTDIFNLGMGAMLHDIGKSLIPVEILNKQQKLNNKELKIVQNHVIEGERMLRLHRDFPEKSLPAATQHHEKLSGTGYPFRLSEPNINLFGKMTAIVDCYDALTTERPYRSAMTLFKLSIRLYKNPKIMTINCLKYLLRCLGGSYNKTLHA